MTWPAISPLMNPLFLSHFQISAIAVVDVKHEVRSVDQRKSSASFNCKLGHRKSQNHIKVRTSSKNNTFHLESCLDKHGVQRLATKDYQRQIKSGGKKLGSFR